MSVSTFFRCCVALLIAGFMCGCTGARLDHVDDPLDTRGRTFTMETPLKAMWVDRDYLVHVPANWNGKEQLPVVVALHGAFMTAEEFEQRSGFSELADKEGFIVIYPEGMGIFGLLQHWNAGYCCGKAQLESIDDVGFIDYCLDDVAKFLPIDEKRVYLAGLSNGGMLSLYYASQRSNRVAAFAVIAGGLPEDRKAYVFPDRPIPLCVIHGTADINIPYTGGPLKNSDDEDAPRFRSTAMMVDDWVQFNGCPEVPQKQLMHEGKVESSLWLDCKEGVSVAYYTIDGFKHDWPHGANVEDVPPEEGVSFSATQLAWEFFEKVDE